MECSFTRMLYQRAISDMVKDIEKCEAIKDDILIWGKDRQQHDERLRYVLDRIKTFNLKLNPEKCEFWRDKFTYSLKLESGQIQKR